MRTNWTRMSSVRRPLAAALLTIGVGVVLAGYGALGDAAALEGEIEAATNAALNSVSNATGGSSAALELAQQQVQILENQLDPIKDELKTTRDALARAEAQVNKTVDELRAELMVQIEEEINHVSLERARLQAVQYAQQHQDVYGDVANQQLIWEVATAEEQEEFYYISINYQPFGGFDGAPGVEEFIMEKNGIIAFRQVISQPDADGTPPVQAEPKPEAAEEKAEEATTEG